MDFSFTTEGWEDFEYWMDTDPDIAVRIRALLKSIRQDPFKGIGKPEPLRYDLKGYWSRRITGEDRLVYKVSGTKGADQKCIIIQCRFHYDD
ncbi:Txe/YoeB family addiction module toxin [Flavobacterium cupreum]|uniref:Putative mRNA interferase YoeB n=1 Tax=Flavobacterium cupreum TaxID=2133766 RepID=A0A434A9K9_9FLAO|nr:Txe/YoeB family addiction module toxin [Flavobacterium cupreum]RUT71037.1 Txe/YoeB family addiction module toxin [Flavobacterium cupreum]